MRKSFFVNRLLILLVLCCGLLLILLIQIRDFHKRHKQTIADEYNTNDYAKFVLYWTPFWFHTDFKIGFGRKPFENCEYKNCFATNDKTLVPVEEFDAIIFHASIYQEKQHGVPAKRLPHQIYIFNNVEAPIYISPNLEKYKSFYNWTMTYRFDSDIVCRHGAFREGNTDYNMPSEDFIKRKTKLAAWFVSNCKSMNAREVLAEEIQKYVPVDVYGNCGKLQCTRKKHDPKLSSAECYDMVEQNYKFYFSFENSYCEDYSTEKLYNILTRNIVPVVYGAGSYSLSAPPNSVINVVDFKNVSELVNYLKYLDQNTIEYLKYFEWKKQYTIVDSDHACQICKKLHEPIKESVYDDLHGWWWRQQNQSVCKVRESLPAIVSNLLPHK